MDAETQQAPATSAAGSRRQQVIGVVTSAKMQKTIVVEVIRRKAHPLYGRVISRTKKLYAHDADHRAHVGDVVRIEETRPLSKLKRWQLKDVVQRAALVSGETRASAEEQPV